MTDFNRVFVIRYDTSIDGKNDIRQSIAKYFTNKKSQFISELAHKIIELIIKIDKLHFLHLAHISHQ